MSQNCDICEYKKFLVNDKDFCYIFRKKPDGQCCQFKPELIKKTQNIKKLAKQIFPQFSKFIK